MRECKFKVGDKVRVVNYGHPIWSFDEMDLPLIQEQEDSKWKVYDLNPELIGQEGTVVDAHLTQDIPRYALEGPRKYAWYDEKQLELLPTSED